MKFSRGALFVAVALILSAGAGAAKNAANDPIQVFRTAKTVEAGRPLVFRLVMRSAKSVTIDVLRLRRARGHGRHRRKARYVRLVSAPFVCVQGLNRLEIAEWQRHKFAPGRYIVVAKDPHFRHRIRIRIRR
jgi:hypothetical protein